MVPALSLWLPILVAAVIVFVASSVIHMVLRYHKNDFQRLPAEAEALAALRSFGLPPGEYFFPFADGGAEMRSDEWQAKVKEGPVGMLTVMPNGPMKMGRNLTQWFVYCLVVGLLTAYLTGLAYGPGTEYMAIFRFAGAAAFVAYAAALWQNSIWWSKPWSTTLKSTFDGLVYGLLTGGTFGWLWPGA